ncbi:MAG: preprotein translocase subunit YajC [Candidatus Brocadiae bacterium]|nr:preprotein translocase subunit YajC [Candidatus Brocadiia bacterium]
MTHLLELLAQAPPGPGPTTTSTGAAPAGPGADSAAAAPQGNSMMTMLVFFGLTLAVMYFLMIRPQQRKDRELKNMVEKLKKNDRVILQNGIFAVIAQVRDKDIIVKIDEKNDIRVRVLKSAILGMERAAPEGERKGEKEKAAETEPTGADA